MRACHAGTGKCLGEGTHPSASRLHACARYHQRRVSFPDNDGGGDRIADTLLSDIEP